MSHNWTGKKQEYWYGKSTKIGKLRKMESWKLNQAFGQYYAYYINQGVRLNLNRVLTLLCGPSNQNWKLAQDIKRAQIILFSILFFKNNRKITLNEKLKIHQNDSKCQELELLRGRLQHEWAGLIRAFFFRFCKFSKR